MQVAATGALHLQDREAARRAVAEERTGSRGVYDKERFQIHLILIIYQNSLKTWLPATLIAQTPPPPALE